jgi:uncharacterized protein (TIRG00374 family)
LKQKLGFRLAAGALFGAVLLAVFFRGVEWRSLVAAFRSAHPGYLLAVVAITVVTYLGRAWRWGYLLAPLARVPLGELFASTVVGFMTGLVIPRAGEVVRPYLIARRRDIPTSAAFASIILERLVDLLTVLLLLGLYLFVLPAPAAQRPGGLVDVLKAGAGLVALASCGVGLVLWAFHRHADRASAIVDRLLAPLPARIGAALSRAFRAFGSGLGVFGSSPGHLLAIFGQSVVVWLTIALGIHCNNRAFGLELPFHASFLIVAFLTVGVAVPTPGMVGGFHESYLLALTQVFGVERGRAAAVGIACHALTNLPVLLGGAYFLGRFGLTLGGVVRITSDVDVERPAAVPPSDLRDRGAA